VATSTNGSSIGNAWLAQQNKYISKFTISWLDNRNVNQKKLVQWWWQLCQWAVALALEIAVPCSNLWLWLQQQIKYQHQLAATAAAATTIGTGGAKVQWQVTATMKVFNLFKAIINQCNWQVQLHSNAGQWMPTACILTAYCWQCWK